MDVTQLEILGPMLVAIVLIVTAGGVLLLRPISKRLAHLLEAMAKERQPRQLGEDLSRIRELLDTMDGRLQLLEERQDFTDALLTDPERRRLREGESSEADG